MRESSERAFPPTNTSTACSNQLFNQQYNNKRWCLNHRMLHCLLLSVLLGSALRCSLDVCFELRGIFFVLIFGFTLWLLNISPSDSKHMTGSVESILPTCSCLSPHHTISFCFGSFMLPKSITNSKESER